MAIAAEVLSMLCSDVEYTLSGENYEDIVWHNGKPAITKEQFEAGFAQYDACKAQQEEEGAAKKAAAEAKLLALGLTTDDLKALGLA
jgi:hypothetical protein